jgi:hypothetical protein
MLTGPVAELVATAASVETPTCAAHAVQGIVTVTTVLEPEMRAGLVVVSMGIEAAGVVVAVARMGNVWVWVV